MSESKKKLDLLKSFIDNSLEISKSTVILALCVYHKNGDNETKARVEKRVTELSESEDSVNNLFGDWLACCEYECPELVKIFVDRMVGIFSNINTMETVLFHHESVLNMQEVLQRKRKYEGRAYDDLRLLKGSLKQSVHVIAIASNTIDEAIALIPNAKSGLGDFKTLLEPVFTQIDLFLGDIDDIPILIGMYKNNVYKEVRCLVEKRIVALLKDVYDMPKTEGYLSNGSDDSLVYVPIVDCMIKIVQKEITEKTTVESLPEYYFNHVNDCMNLPPRYKAVLKVQIKIMKRI